MINLLSGKTVGDFFRNVNWRGLPSSGDLGEEKPISLSLSLTVERFFSLYNWNGKSSSPLVSSCPTPSLTMSVAEFFLRMGWHSPSPNSPPPQVVHDMPPRGWEKRQINLKDLSELF